MLIIIVIRLSLRQGALSGSLVTPRMGGLCRHCPFTIPLDSAQASEDAPVRRSLIFLELVSSQTRHKLY
jgi:hypothetical protein